MKNMIMIGNSHIDPVWFWNWKEGMQEVKATFASALARMEEYPDFRFTCTSTAFLEWIQKIDPEMFEQIKKRVAEGRWELTGGWFVEPDCIVPCGEAFARQGLYGQRYLMEQFNQIARTGSNVDSFGHSGSLPQILSLSGMDSYVFMRPRKKETPIMEWYSKDGSHVTAVSLPSEYTTWHDAMTAENIELALHADWATESKACCYGVGNHGGGPTIENIESIHARSDQYHEAKLVMGTWETFFDEVKKEVSEGLALPEFHGIMDRINVGCYTTDSAFKKLNRETEERLMQADRYLSMVYQLTGKWMEQTKQLKELWKALLFNQFHDTMGGTVIKEAREDAMRQVSAVYAQADQICAIAMQKLMNTVNTAQKDYKEYGFPLFLFNTGAQDYCDLVEVELNWHCKWKLCLYDPQGNEVPYQVIHTECKTRNYNIGGRRRFVFRAEIPAGGFAIYRVADKESSVCDTPNFEIGNPSAAYLENENIRVKIDPRTGMITEIYDKVNQYSSLKQPMELCLYYDERDAWGGLQGKTAQEVFYQKEDKPVLLGLEKVESGKIREQIRARFRLGQSHIELMYSLGEGEKEVTVRFRVLFCDQWSALRLKLPVGSCANHIYAEDAYGVSEYIPEDALAHPMHRFLDAAEENGSGLVIANDGKYAFAYEDGDLFIECARSPIYAQGYNRDWYCDKEWYRYHDMYEQDFCLVLQPHGKKVSPAEWYRLANKAHGYPEYLQDSSHGGSMILQDSVFCGLKNESDHVQLVLTKRAEEDDALILRLLETDGIAGEVSVRVGEHQIREKIRPYEILTLKYDPIQKMTKKVNLLEW